jgi:protein-S-isoprenylcysteine O-methyltransferase Ste14
MVERRQMKQGKIVRFGDFIFRHRDTLPVPFISIAVAVLIFTTPTFTDSSARSMLFILGALIVLSGEAVRVWAVGYSGSTTRSRSLIADRLVREGPYSIVRNPLYVGNFLIALGFSIMANAVTVIPLVIIYFAAEYYPVVLREEYFLLEKFGDDYRQYLSDVPRFFPKNLKIKKTAYNPSALKGEMWTMLGIVLMLAVMIGIDFLRVGWIKQ